MDASGRWHIGLCEDFSEHPLKIGFSAASNESFDKGFLRSEVECGARFMPTLYTKSLPAGELVCYLDLSTIVYNIQRNPYDLRVPAFEDGRIDLPAIPHLPKNRHPLRDIIT
ncbi:uncharacterized protein SPPG_08894 [Spizellomyces punctatus DAOM BR117]|uniref:Uncharacterized protein n=1 Tax=Spizellomyces punctatus (strain DAOM BR117) TaxID=645134 RepID=A0A0L0HRK3_SPIPD|nr:uncharacterized protein SPPG_08894 [Spizellomyces punctatus DAOM BR117]KND03504.1 hypothetical protein SPPG_08894 [Spizellomyces punctatus DAOM BR117]|eukprot:XP_016611543.1 hypothetical protein SPPG_08894 [Spizellomyces punctatus DAOM BR117]